VSFDVVILGGRVINGAGAPWVRADIAVEDGVIVEIGYLKHPQADVVIKADGLFVSPGFIDIHNHSDLALLIDPIADSMIRQGVTTIAIGNCGLSVAPIRREIIERFKKHVEAFAPAQVEWRWESFDDYLRVLEERGVGVNVVPLVGHGTIRANVLGFEPKEPSESELNEMKSLVEESMRAGAFGLTTGLIYLPGMYAGTDEIIELAKVAAKYGGIYASHIRSESFALIEAVSEAIEIGEKASIPVEISHHKASGVENWGKVKTTLKLMEDARLRGVDVTCDVYPYTAGMTSLSALLPPWAQAGGVEEIIDRLKQSSIRAKIVGEMRSGVKGKEDLLRGAGWDGIVVAYSKRHKEFEGKSLSEVAEIWGKDVFDAFFDLIVEDEGATMIVLHLMSEDDVRYVISHRLSMIATDGWAVSPRGPMSAGKPHPRFYGTYPRVLAKYVRREKLLSLEEAVKKMSWMPAQKLGLWNRGLIAKGMVADIVVFDFNSIEDKATFEDPHRYPDGIKYVLVNGELVIDDGKHTGKLAGRVLRRHFIAH